MKWSAASASNHSQHKLECLVALCRTLLHPQPDFDNSEKTKSVFGKVKKMSAQNGMKHPEMAKAKVKKNSC